MILKFLSRRSCRSERSGFSLILWSLEPNLSLSVNWRDSPLLYQITFGWENVFDWITGSSVHSTRLHPVFIPSQIPASGPFYLSSVGIHNQDILLLYISAGFSSPSIFKSDVSHAPWSSSFQPKYSIKRQEQQKILNFYETSFPFQFSLRSLFRNAFCQIQRWGNQKEIIHKSHN